MNNVILVFIYFLIGGLIGFLTAGKEVPRLSQRMQQTIIFAVVLSGISFGWIYMFNQGYVEYKNPATYMIDKWDVAAAGAKNWWDSFECSLDPDCQAKIWQDPVVESAQPEIDIDIRLQRSNLLETDGEISATVFLDISKPGGIEEVRIKPTCSLSDGTELDAVLEERDQEGEYIVISSETKAYTTSFQCEGYTNTENPITKTKLIIKLERPVSVETTWDVYLSKISDGSKGITRARQTNYAPYTLSLGSGVSQPFTEGNYIFDVSMKKNIGEKSEIKKINYLRVWEMSANLDIQCRGFSKSGQIAEIMDIPKEKLDKVYYNSQDKAYEFNCVLDVLNEPSQEEPEREFVMARSTYLVEQTTEKTITITQETTEE